jgi:predicted nucleic-acid-binding protein
MIGIDTNILVRYIVQDDKQQADLATYLLEERLNDKNRGLVSAVVLCELVWVLSRAYGYGKEQVSEVLRTMLASADLVIDRMDDAFRALREYERGAADFSDYYIGQMNHTLNAETTYTLDQKAAVGSRFTPLENA